MQARMRGTLHSPRRTGKPLTSRRTGQMGIGSSSVRPWVLDLLACPSCGGALAEHPAPGGLRCVACGARYSVKRGIPRFVDDDAYAGNFSFEWTIHARTQLDDATSKESEQTFVEKTGLGRQDVSGRTVLDVGCGMGRFSDVVSRWG